MPQNKVLTIIGWILTTLVTLMMCTGIVFQYIDNPGINEQKKLFTDKFGYPADVAFPLAIVQLVCGILFFIPQTAVLGAILLTGYLGGAVATHMRVHDNFAMAVVVGVVVWLALYLRDARVRALLPFRR
ncbi:MAG: DoxX family protein [Gemmataceae bacterium]